MSFTPASMDKMATAATSDGLKWWDYRTTDTLATVEVPDYFAPFASEFNVSDKILVTGSDNMAVYYVTARTTPVNVQGVVTQRLANSVTIRRAI